MQVGPKLSSHFLFIILLALIRYKWGSGLFVCNKIPGYLYLCPTVYSVCHWAKRSNKTMSNIFSLSCLVLYRVDVCALLGLFCICGLSNRLKDWLTYGHYDLLVCFCTKKWNHAYHNIFHWHLTSISTVKKRILHWCK